MNWRIMLVSFLENVGKISTHPNERLKETGLKEGDIFLDIGCGLGFYSFCASNIVGERGVVYAVDINSDLVAYVESKARKKVIRNILTIVADARETGLPRKSVDTIFLHLVLHDIKDKHAAFNEFNRVLKTGGKLVVDEENVMSLSEVRRLAEASGFMFSKRIGRTIQVFGKTEDRIQEKSLENSVKCS